LVPAIKPAETLNDEKSMDDHLAEILVCEEDARNNVVRNYEFVEYLPLFVVENSMVDIAGFLIPRWPISIDRPLFVPFLDSLATIADFPGETRAVFRSHSGNLLVKIYSRLLRKRE
jgi:hypothetical protein